MPIAPATTNAPVMAVQLKRYHVSVSGPATRVMKVPPLVVRGPIVPTVVGVVNPELSSDCTVTVVRAAERSAARQAAPTSDCSG